MNTLRPLVLVLVGCLALAAAPAAARAHDDNDDGCRTVKAFGVGQDFGDGTTTATITRGGILNGTTAATFAITGGTPPVLEFDGTITFTTRHGTLTVAIAGVFDISAGTTGIFDASGPVVGGTGRFAGATGTLRFVGVEDLVTGAFVEVVTGSLCLVEDDED